MTRATKPAARARLAAAGITPRGLSLDEAAAYVSLAPATFLREVAAGRHADGPFVLVAVQRVKRAQAIVQVRGELVQGDVHGAIR